MTIKTMIISSLDMAKIKGINGSGSMENCQGNYEPRMCVKCGARGICRREIGKEKLMLE